MAMEKKQCLTHALKITEEAARGGYQKSLDVLLDNLYKKIVELAKNTKN